MLSDKKSNASMMRMSVDSNRGLPFKPTEAMAVCYYQKHFLHPCGGQSLIYHLMACSFMESHMMEDVHRATHHTCAICDDCYLFHVQLRETRLVRLITVFYGEETKYSFSADNREFHLTREDAKLMGKEKTGRRHLRDLHPFKGKRVHLVVISTTTASSYMNQGKYTDC